MMRASRMIAQATLLLLLAASAYNTVQGTPLAHCLQPKGPGGLFNSTLPRCEDGQTSHIDPNSRVAIIGGGPAGTMMAKLLNDRGIKATTLPEPPECTTYHSSRVCLHSICAGA